jgi:hypothetical protein
LPTQPTITQPDDVCFNGGDIVFTATGYTGSLEWVSNGGGSESGNSVTFNSSATGTKTVTARSSQTHLNASACYSTTVTQSASILALPATPTLAVSASTVCLGTDIIFRVNSPVGGETYTWTGAAGTASGTGDGTYTVSGATTGTKSVTAFAHLTSSGTTCQSGNTSLSALVSQPGTDGQAVDPTCACADGTTPCGSTCKTSGTYTDDLGDCTGSCHFRYVRQLDQCGTVVNARYSSYNYTGCLTGCCTPASGGHVFLEMPNLGDVPTSAQANSACQNARYPGCSDSGGTDYATSWTPASCNVNCSKFHSQVECSCSCR